MKLPRFKLLVDWFVAWRCEYHRDHSILSLLYWIQRPSHTFIDPEFNKICKLSMYINVKLLESPQGIPVSYSTRRNFSIYISSYFLDLGSQLQWKSAHHIQCCKLGRFNFEELICGRFLFIFQKLLCAQIVCFCTLLDSIQWYW